MSLGGDEFARLVEAKRSGREHAGEDIERLVRAYVQGELGDEMFAQWLRAVVASGLSDDETAWLTQAMAASGQTISWRDVTGVIVDKHSTGGVGDDVSLVAVPLAAACGINVAKLSGRALGHTGGTIDKLETVPHLRTDLPVEAFKRQVASVGCAIVAATDEIAPADKKIYALRHRTNTVDSIGLIAASVLSKKIAGGAPCLAIDVKCGRCAFMQTEARARELARTIVHVAARLGRSVTVLVTDMDEPLADSIGDALEMEEALAVLQGRSRGRLRDVSLALAEAMLAVPLGDERTGAPARLAALDRALDDGRAYQRLAAMVRAQGGDLQAFSRGGMPSISVTADRGGFIATIDGRSLGAAVAAHKRGAERPEWHARGIRLRKRRGDAVARGETIAEVFAHDRPEVLVQAVSASVSIVTEPIEPPGPPVIARFHASVATDR